MLLIAGGAFDPNITAILRQAKASDVPTMNVLTTSDHPSAFSWDVVTGDVVINGVINPKIWACYIRHDVFDRDGKPNPNAEPRNSNWFYAMWSWVECSPNVNLLNRKIGLRQLSKPYVLYLASQLGMRVPHTLITNEICRIESGMAKDRLVAKPVNGGGYCVAIEKALQDCRNDELVPSPAIVQTRLEYPEVRIYRIGSEYFSFELTSKDLDYREYQSASIRYLSNDVLSIEITLLEQLTNRLGMDFTAADFKTCPKTGDLVLLEVNTSPMFAAFNKKTNGAIVESILQYLVQKKASHHL